MVPPRYQGAERHKAASVAPDLRPAGTASSVIGSAVPAHGVPHTLSAPAVKELAASHGTVPIGHVDGHGGNAVGCPRVRVFLVSAWLWANQNQAVFLLTTLIRTLPRAYLSPSSFIFLPLSSLFFLSSFPFLLSSFLIPLFPRHLTKSTYSFHFLELCPPAAVLCPVVKMAASDGISPSTAPVEHYCLGLPIFPQSCLQEELVPSNHSQSDASESMGSTAASSINDVQIHRSLVPGVYVPTVCFFDELTEDLDMETIGKHVMRLAKAGVAGITTQGSNGEAVHLTHHERILVTSVTRRALNEAGFDTMPVLVGCGAQSTRETIELCRDAAIAGGDYALVLPPAYYQSSFTSSTTVEFFQTVATASPIPVVVYNYPGAVAGIDLDSDTIVQLAQHPNIVGCKLTCGNTGKLNRVAAATGALTLADPGSGYMCMGGSADFILPMLVSGGSGVIGGLANVVPKACVEIFRLFESGHMAKAQRMQEVVARGDWAAIRGGVVGIKSVLQTYFEYGGFGRKPLPRPTAEDVAKYAESFQEVVALEQSL